MKNKPAVQSEMFWKLTWLMIDKMDVRELFPNQAITSWTNDNVLKINNK